MLGVAPHADDEIESGLGGGFAAGGVQRGAVLAELEHFAGDENAAPGRDARRGCESWSAALRGWSCSCR